MDIPLLLGGNMKKIWKDIPGYEGLYQISEDGEVKSLERIFYCGVNHALKKVYPEKIMKARLDHNNHERITFHKDGKCKSFFIHRLMWETFVGEIEDGFEIHHKDFNKSNNLISNLEKLTCAEHMQLHRKIDNLGYKNFYGKKHSEAAREKMRNAWKIRKGEV